MKTQDLKVGDRFYFRGDWQTEPGNWEVVAIDPLTDGPECRPAGSPTAKTSLFHRNVTVDPINGELQ